MKREINEEMKVFSDSEAGETELFIPSAPFGLLCRLRGGGGDRGALVSFCWVPGTPQLPLQVQNRGQLMGCISEVCQPQI